MIHKHEWIYSREAEDYLQNNNVIITYGRYYICNKCKEEKHVGSSSIYLSGMGRYCGNSYDPTKGLPKYSLK